MWDDWLGNLAYDEYWQAHEEHGVETLNGKLQWMLFK